MIEYQRLQKAKSIYRNYKAFVDKFTNWLVNSKNYSTNYSGKQLEILKNCLY
jgi:hypothetical protein